MYTYSIERENGKKNQYHLQTLWVLCTIGIEPNAAAYTLLFRSMNLLEMGTAVREPQRHIGYIGDRHTCVIRVCTVAVPLNKPPVNCTYVYTVHLRRRRRRPSYVNVFLSFFRFRATDEVKETTNAYNNEEERIQFLFHYVEVARVRLGEPVFTAREIRRYL